MSSAPRPRLWGGILSRNKSNRKSTALPERIFSGDPKLVDYEGKKPGRTQPHIAHLNGLRAFAFTGVVLFHFKHGFQGGFLGVDVFFILSGYLMTRSISAQLASSTFSYPAFLARRFWRLYPALLCAILGTLALTFCFFSSDLAVGVARSSVASVLGVSNLLFLSEKGYFATESVLKPLLHTWSLSVEWQFYLVWPVMMAAGSRFGPFARPLWPLVALCAASFLYGTQLAAVDPSAAFFGLPGRAFEFGLGALAATSAPTVSSRLLGNFMAAFGSAMVLVSFVIVRPSDGTPAVIALPALLGALLVILSPSDAFCNRLYTSYAGDYLGKISYSAYLVHWPVYVFYNDVVQHYEAPWQVECIVVVCMMVVSALMYHHVEDKYRVVKRRRHQLVGLGLLTGALAVSYTGIVANGWSWRRSPILPQNSLAFLPFGLKDEMEGMYGPRRQMLGADDKGLEIPVGYIPPSPSDLVSQGEIFDALVIGDSFAPVLAPALREIAAETSQKFVISRFFGCPVFFDPESLDDTVYENRKDLQFDEELLCKKHLRRRILDVVKKVKTDTVILFNCWPGLFQTLRMRDESVSFDFDKNAARSPTWRRKVSQFEQTVDVLLDAGKKVVFVGVTPEATFNVKTCYTARGPLAFLKNCPSQINLGSHDSKTRRFINTRNAFSLLMKESPSISVAISSQKFVYIDPLQTMCDQESQTCTLAQDSELYFYDDRHPTRPNAIKMKSAIHDALLYLRKQPRNVARVVNATAEHTAVS